MNILVVNNSLLLIILKVFTLVEQHVSARPAVRVLANLGHPVVDLDLVVFHYFNSRVVALDPLPLAFDQRVVVPEAKSLACMHHNALQMVNSWLFAYVDEELFGVGNPVCQLLMDIGVRIDFESLQVDEEYFGTSANCDFLCRHLLGLALFAVKLIFLVEELLK